MSGGTTAVQGSAHQILGLKHGATKDDIKRRYRQLCMKWHPDMVEPNQRIQAEAMFKKITEAFSYLEKECESNPQPQSQPQTSAQPSPQPEHPPHEARPKSTSERYNETDHEQFSYTDPFQFNYKYYGKGRKPFDFGSSMSGGFQSMNAERTKYQKGGSTKYQRNMQYDTKGWKPKNYHERYYRYYYYNAQDMNWTREAPDRIKLGKALGASAVVFFVVPVIGYIGWNAMQNDRGVGEFLQWLPSLSGYEGDDPNNPFPNRRPIW
eukprot:TRINITY_DN1846_c0_g4_i2.p1 TRINITY_DN1846_c0_g4~~TRINITY_DN1846_c0_g4_i2.p1  ORF type:complete len:265 (-),score=30.81 TRINITY_DN1846_c0_g4_i2:1106-1900(-)